MLCPSACSPCFWSRSVINSLILDSSGEPLHSSGTSLEVFLRSVLHRFCDNMAGFNKSAEDLRIARTGKENQGPPLVFSLYTGRCDNTMNVGLQDASAEKSQRVSNIANCMSRDGSDVGPLLVTGGEHLKSTEAIVQEAQTAKIGMGA